jgi:hypothetical protein
MRMTVHLIPSEDAGWMLPLFEPIQERWSRRRLGQLGMPPRIQEKAMREVARVLAEEGPMTRNAVREELRRQEIELDQQTGLHVVGLATVSGIACQGPDIGASPSLVRREDWLGESSALDREAALAELARRYLTAFGPANERDFAKWSGLPLRDLRGGLAAIASELREVRFGGRTLLSLAAKRPRLPRAGQVRLLGAFDTYILGYASRDFAVAVRPGKGINVRGGGMIEPVIVRDGEVLGLWGLKRDKGRLQVALDPFEPLDAEVEEAIAAEIDDIARFEGAPCAMVGTDGT